MSVYKPDDSPYYYAAYTDELDRRIRVSTKQITKRGALAVEAELRNRVERIRLGLEIRDRNPGRRTVADGAGWWLTTIASRQAQSAKVTPVIKRHIVGSRIGTLPLEQVTPGAVTAWLHAKEKEVSPATANKLRAYLMSIFSRLIEHGEYLGENPVRQTKKIKVAPTKSRALPASYVQALMSNPPTLGWLVAFTAAAYAGMRRSELDRVFGTKTWPDVDLDARIITITKTKADRPRRVAIHPVLLDVLKHARRHGVVMPTAGAFEGAHERVREALRRGGIVNDRATFHGLRGTWATTLVSCGASPDIVRFMGWGARTDSVMELNYIAYPDEVLRREIDRLEYPIKESE